ncbi:conserved hypothetical protein [Echinococcus multilocularis]|uniref:Uncharacterized protein n=1 Tax=Echinococcus multilocularis TaxID=6211 RepID=A0A068Y2D4_ECHMU|nr:conserved hypothetical protein [Echinococcus multilocularis]
MNVPGHISFSYDKNMYKCLYTLRYEKAKADYECNLKKRRQKMHELFNKDSELLDQVPLKIEEDRYLRRKQLREEIEELRKLKEIECETLAKAGYRKQTTMNKDNYRPLLNKLYMQDLNAQVELNKQIKAYENRKEEGMAKMTWLPVGHDCGNGNTRPKRDLNEELRDAMSAREAKLSEIAKQKEREAEEMREREEVCLREKAEATKAAYERRAMLRGAFEQQIKERNQELWTKKVEDARVSAWLTSNATQQVLVMKDKSLHDKAIAKQRALNFFDYVKQLEEEKQLEEKRREWAMERIASDMMEANEAKQRQIGEASQALEREIRQAQLKQIREKEGRSIVPTTDGGLSFLDKMHANDDRRVDGARIISQENSHYLQQQIAQKPSTALFEDCGMEGREFTRSPQRFHEEDLATYEYLNPLRKLSLKEMEF